MSSEEEPAVGSTEFYLRLIRDDLRADSSFACPRCLAVGAEPVGMVRWWAVSEEEAELHCSNLAVCRWTLLKVPDHLRRRRIACAFDDVRSSSWTGREDALRPKGQPPPQLVPPPSDARSPGKPEDAAGDAQEDTGAPESAKADEGDSARPPPTTEPPTPAPRQRVFSGLSDHDPNLFLPHDVSLDADDMEETLGKPCEAPEETASPSKDLPQPSASQESATSRLPADFSQDDSVAEARPTPSTSKPSQPAKKSKAQPQKESPAKLEPAEKPSPGARSPLELVKELPLPPPVKKARLVSPSGSSSKGSQRESVDTAKSQADVFMEALGELGGPVVSSHPPKASKATDKARADDPKEEETKEDPDEAKKAVESAEEVEVVGEVQAELAEDDDDDEDEEETDTEKSPKKVPKPQSSAKTEAPTSSKAAGKPVDKPKASPQKEKTKASESAPGKTAVAAPAAVAQQPMFSSVSVGRGSRGRLSAALDPGKAALALRQKSAIAPQRPKKAHDTSVQQSLAELRAHLSTESPNLSANRPGQGRKSDLKRAQAREEEDGEDGPPMPYVRGISPVKQLSPTLRSVPLPKTTPITPTPAPTASTAPAPAPAPATSAAAAAPPSPKQLAAPKLDLATKLKMKLAQKMLQQKAASAKKASPPDFGHVGQAGGAGQAGTPGPSALFAQPPPAQPLAQAPVDDSMDMSVDFPFPSHFPQGHQDDTGDIFGL